MSDDATTPESISILATPDRSSRSSRSGRRKLDRPRRRGRVLLVLFLLALPFIAAAGWFWYQVDPPGGPGAAVTVAIPKGAGVDAIGNQLESRGVVGSSPGITVPSEIRKRFIYDITTKPRSF